MSLDLKIGERVALAMRRGVVVQISSTAFKLKLDGGDDCIWIEAGTTPWLQERLEVPEPTDLRAAIERAVNRFSAENGSNTPDFILADYLVACLTMFDATVNRRDEWWQNRSRLRPGAKLGDENDIADRPTVNPSEPPK